MATVRIGERDLRVLGEQDRGSFKRDVDLVMLTEELKDVTGSAAQMKFAEMILVYVRENDPPVTLEWIVANLTADVVGVLRQCTVAAGRKVKESAPGEAPRP